MNDISVNNLIQSSYPSLHTAERKVADYIANNAKEVVNLSVTELSERSSASEATIVRACKKIGFKGYYHLKIALAKEVINPAAPSLDDFESDNLSQMAGYLVQKQADDLIRTATFFDDSTLAGVMNLLNECDTLFFFGAGNSNPLAVYAAYKFSQLGVKTVAHVSPEMQLNMAYSMTDKDIAFGISNSGSTNLIVDIFNIAKIKNAKSVCITNYLKSPISKLATYQINTTVSDKIYFEAFDSTRVSATAIIDTLILMFMKLHKERYEIYREREEFLGSIFKG